MATITNPTNKFQTILANRKRIARDEAKKAAGTYIEIDMIALLIG
tara:strand:+ start:1051 stop:1185 length:135 start_codon:yes stop_codon:yes gene_type:complete